MLILALILSFALILFLVHKKINLGFSTMAGALLLALMSGLSVGETARIFIMALLERATIELAVDVFLIVVFSKMMEDYGVLAKMVDSLEKLFGSAKVMLFIIPSLLSTFTVTGAAIVAAPVIDNLGEKAGLSKARRAAINLYIRHAWYFFLPISISLLYAAYVANIPISKIIIAQLPVTLATLLAGYLVYIRPIKTNGMGIQPERSLQVIRNVLLYASPLLLCIVLVFWIPLYAALVITSILTYFLKDNDKKLFDVLLKGPNKSYNLIIAVAGVMIFKHVIQNIPQMETLMQQVTGLGIPLWLTAVILASALGFVSGNSQLPPAMLYPLLFSLIPPEQTVAYAMLIYTTGFTLYYISPIHLCQALTNEYFEVSLPELYREYYITVPVMFFSGIITYFLLI
ncbi:MAG: DUF401 family protein [Clostridia bacterium]|nr:DUF401 family protein [Clostridia bacterium]